MNKAIKLPQNNSFFYKIAKTLNGLNLFSKKVTLTPLRFAMHASTETVAIIIAKMTSTAQINNLFIFRRRNT